MQPKSKGSDTIRVIGNR